MEKFPESAFPSPMLHKHQRFVSIADERWLRSTGPDPSNAGLATARSIPEKTG
jgi:hypothetical protein